MEIRTEEFQRLAVGFKSHSGWAAAVTIAHRGGDYAVIDRRRIELTVKGEFWAKQPYHAAEELDPEAARRLVERGVASAYSVARNQIDKLLQEVGRRNYQVAAIAVLVPLPMPDWRVDEILAVHPRMHKAEGVLFPDALCGAIEDRKLPLVRVVEKQLSDIAEDKLKEPFERIMQRAKVIGEAVGPPWGKDQKLSAVAAMIALATAQSPGPTTSGSVH